jgi:hypothetical protein
LPEKTDENPRPTRADNVLMIDITSPPVNTVDKPEFRVSVRPSHSMVLDGANPYDSNPWPLGAGSVDQVLKKAAEDFRKRYGDTGRARLSVEIKRQTPQSEIDKITDLAKRAGFEKIDVLQAEKPEETKTFVPTEAPLDKSE